MPERRSTRQQWNRKMANRRAVLMTCGAGLTGALAGCLGDTEEGGSDGTGGGGDDSNPSSGTTDGDDRASGTDDDNHPEPDPDQFVDKELVIPHHRGDMEGRHWNKHIPREAWFQGGNEPPGHLMVDHLVYVRDDTAASMGVIATDWDIVDDNQVIEVELRDDHYWHDGDPFTAEDLHTEAQMDILIRQHDETYEDFLLADTEVVDDHFIRYELHQSSNPEWAEFSVLNFQPTKKAEFWADWWDRLQDAEPGTEEFGEALTDLVSDQSFPIVGHGVFELEDAHEGTAILTKFEDHWNADNLNFDTVRFEEHEDITQAFLQEQANAVLDWMPIEPDLENQMPENYQYNGTDNMRSFFIGFSHGEGDAPGGPTEDMHIRRAIVLASDEEAVARNLGPNYEPILDQTVTYFPPELVEEGTIDTSGFIEYRGQNIDAAIEEIEKSENYFYEDDSVVDEDGEVVSIDLIARNMDERLPIVQTVGQNITDIGFESVIHALDQSTYDQRRADGEYDLRGDRSGSAHQSMFYLTDWEDPQARGQIGTELDVPMPIGEPDGNLETINMANELGRLHTSVDEDELNEQMNRIAWIWNSYLPFEAELAVGLVWGCLNTDDFVVVDGDEDAELLGGLNHWHSRIPASTDALRAVPDNY